MKKLLFLFLTAVMVSPLFAGNNAFPEISMAQINKAIAAKDVTLLDVNGVESYKNGHIPGAIDYIANKKDIAKLLPANKSALIVAYCGNEHCGAYAAAAQAATDLGYTNVKHFKPGIAGWKAANQPTDKGTNP